MKTTSLIALTTALLFSATPLAFAQTAGAGAAVDLSLDANADGTVDANEAAAGVSAGASADAEVDMTLDANGDGTVDETEAAAGAEAGAAADADTSINEVCSSVDLTGMDMGADQAANLAAATSAQVIRLTDCADGSTGTLSADALAAVTANAAITTTLQQESVDASEIIGLIVDEQAVTIYVREDDETSEDAMAPAAQ